MFFTRKPSKSSIITVVIPPARSKELWHRFVLSLGESERKLLLEDKNIFDTNFETSQFVCERCVEEGNARSDSSVFGKDIESNFKCPNGHSGHFIQSEFAI